MVNICLEKNQHILEGSSTGVVNLRNGWDVLVVEWFVVGIAVGVPPVFRLDRRAGPGGESRESSIQYFRRQKQEI
jgi:hypothetical protein